MLHCIFCLNELNEHTKPEHVLLNALGGRRTTRRVICSVCNNRFGNGIDKALAKQVEYIRNLLQLPSGTGDAPPKLRKVASGSEFLDFSNDGTPERKVKPFEVTPLPDGRFEVNFNVTSLDEVNRHLPHVAALTGISEDELRAQLVHGNARSVEQRPDTVHLPNVFGGEDAIRSVVKSCLVLWALKVGNAELAKPVYGRAKAFVLNGDAQFNRTIATIDSRACEAEELLERDFGPSFNLISVQSDENGRVVGHFTLYNIIGFHAVLAESGGVPNVSTALASNPLDPTQWSDELTTGTTFGWIDRPVRDERLTKQRMDKAARLYFERSTPVEHARIKSAVFEKYGVQQGGSVPDALQASIEAEIAERVMRHVLGEAHEEPISKDELTRHLGKR